MLSRTPAAREGWAREPSAWAGWLGGLLSALDGSTVPLALYSMWRALGSDLPSLQFVLLTYLAGVTALVVPAGALADRWGARHAYALGLAVFAIGAFGASIAPALGTVLLARLVQGVGGAFILSAHQALLSLALPTGRRGAGFGLLHASVGLGLLAGPLAGGPLVAAWGWRAGFLPQAAVGLLAFGMLVPGGQFARDRPARAGRAGDLSALASWPVLAGLLAAFLCFVAMAANMYLMPLFLQDGGGYGPAGAGVLLATVPAVIIALAPVAGAWADRVGIRLPTTLGLLLVGAGIAMMAQLRAGVAPVGIAGTLAVYGAGAALFQGPNNSSVVGAVPPSLAGRAAGFLVVARNGGQLVGVALATWFWNARGADLRAYGDTFWLLAAVAGGGALVAALRREPEQPAARAATDQGASAL